MITLSVIWHRYFRFRRLQNRMPSQFPLSGAQYSAHVSMAALRTLCGTDDLTLSDWRGYGSHWIE